MNKESIASMRFDLQVIASWIEPGSRIIDLGCGKGDLLNYLKQIKNVRGMGIEQDEGRVAQCISEGLSVVQGDINDELKDYPANTFDYVVLSQTLQQVYNPEQLIHDMLRAGKHGIVSFPNFGHWRIRTQLLLTGRAPKTRELPFEWYDSPNIRCIALKDFRSFCRKKGFVIQKHVPIDTYYHETEGHVVQFLPNVRATYGIFLLGSA